MPRRIKVVTVCGVGALLMTVFVLLPSPALIERFGELIATDQLDASFRMTVWRDSLDVVAAYPVFGCGLGGFLSAFSRYKTGAPQYDVDYAHNDYLQFLAEIGGIGFAVAAVFLIAVALALLRRVAACRDLEQKSLAAACLASLLAIAAHSLVDFNLYIPANALAVSWVIGLPPGRVCRHHTWSVGRGVAGGGGGSDAHLALGCASEPERRIEVHRDGPEHDQPSGT